jgi:hypothetical protein
MAPRRGVDRSMRAAADVDWFEQAFMVSLSNHEGVRTSGASWFDRLTMKRTPWP